MDHKIPIFPDAWAKPWPDNLDPCPVCRRRHRKILIGSNDGCIEHYQCPACGWFCGGDYVASTAVWNSDARKEARQDHR